eukprot:Blabericola_migrator_1__12785@NODE_821_length_6384_cov_57_760329_g579_i0_p9_GENE_NODE_821_length_6384_cov_57_760329_g579_i0NODE_821_length_6384_cov_57_760329_g579_i0_p9_ORF_typecomplete_len147_score25_29DUF2151/PF10221_9/0_26_NODE_821_length_6384_cov_57_760329_g579_i026343074
MGTWRKDNITMLQSAVAVTSIPLTFHPEAVMITPLVANPILLAIWCTPSIAITIVILTFLQGALRVTPAIPSHLKKTCLWTFTTLIRDGLCLWPGEYIIRLLGVAIYQSLLCCLSRCWSLRLTLIRLCRLLLLLVGVVCLRLILRW